MSIILSNQMPFVSMLYVCTYDLLLQANVRQCKQRLNDALTQDVDPELWSRKITSIQKCIEKCRNEKIPDTDEDIIYAMKEVELLRHRNCKLFVQVS